MLTSRPDAGELPVQVTVTTGRVEVVVVPTPVGVPLLPVLDPVVPVAVLVPVFVPVLVPVFVPVLVPVFVPVLAPVFVAVPEPVTLEPPVAPPDVAVSPVSETTPSESSLSDLQANSNSSENTVRRIRTSTTGEGGG